MKKFLFTATVLLGIIVYGQNTGIGTTNPEASAQLDINSTNKGVLFPRIALTAKNEAAPVNAPATGLKVYNTATAGTGATLVTPGFYYWDGIQWIRESEGELVRKLDETDPTKVGYTLRGIRDFNNTTTDGITGGFGIKNIGQGSIDFMTYRNGTSIENAGWGSLYFNIFDQNDFGVFGDNSISWGAANKITGQFDSVWGTDHLVGGIGNTVWGVGAITQPPPPIKPGNPKEKNLQRETLNKEFGGNIVHGIGNTVWGRGNIIKDRTSENLYMPLQQFNTVSGIKNILDGYSYDNFVFGFFNNLSDSFDSSNSRNFILGQEIQLGNAHNTINLGTRPTLNSYLDKRLLTVGNGKLFGLTSEMYSDAFTILRDGRIGIAIDDFQNTNSYAKLQVNGRVLIGNFGDLDTNNNIINTAPSSDASLNVLGEVKVGNNNIICNATNEGSIRYVKTAGVGNFEGCRDNNGAFQWIKINP